MVVGQIQPYRNALVVPIEKGVIMTIKHIIAAASIVLVGALTVPVASAINKGTYFGIASGESEGDVSVSDFDDGSLTSDTGLRLFAGFQFTDGFAIEGGLVDLGEVTFDGTSNGGLFPIGFASGPVSADIETQGVYAALIGMKTFPLVSIFGKLGVLAWGADGEIVDNSGSFDLDDFDFEESGESTIVGFGIEVRPRRKMAIRAEWERYQDALVDERDIDFIALSILFRR